MGRFAVFKATTLGIGFAYNSFARSRRKVFTLSVVVILSHYVQGNNTFQDGHVVPPIMLTRPDSLAASGNYKFNMNSAAESIERLIARGMDAVWALSVTMKGRWT
ncbi:hypothetical protein MRX96_014852 [Rhipicephalus microplus]